MTDITLEPFDLIRAQLHAATSRDIARADRSRRRVVTMAVAFAAVVLVTGLAAAANERVGEALTDLTQPIRSVFGGPDTDEQPSDAARDSLSFMEALRRGENPGLSHPATEPGRVLLHDHIGGQEVEIVAMERPQGSPSGHGPIKRAETCWSTIVDGRSEGTTCSPQFMPGVAVNYGVQAGTDREGQLVEMTISGVAGDGVAAIEVLTEDGLEPALFAEHAFYWHSDHARARAVEITLEDGRHIRKTQLLDSVGRPLRDVTSRRSRSARRARPPR